MKTEMTTRDKVRDALWRYAPEKTERVIVVAVVVGAAVMSAGSWLAKGKVIPK